VEVLELEALQRQQDMVLLAVMDMAAEQALRVRQAKALLEELVFGVDQTVHQVAEVVQVVQVLERQTLQQEQVEQD
jgi:hypothetical protein|tara:strand:- start:226 stop:453 length:228 start_codon:yes stop_codon:yes gene_type:complete